MQRLSQKFLDECPVEDGFRMRGMAMTRIEVFVDAAFAFAVTLLVISFDAIPRTYPEMVVAFKTIPAFLAAAAQLVWLWHTHATWCQRFGLEDGPTVWLSALLLVVVLIYIYPMRVLLEGFFAWISQGFFATSFELTSYDELRLMFVFMSMAFAALCLCFMLMYRYALAQREQLRLNKLEVNKAVSVVKIWAGCMVIAVMLIVLALNVPEAWVPYTGFVMILIGVWIPYVETRHYRIAQSLEDNI